MNTMNPRRHTALLLFAVGAAYFWTQISWLSTYSLQAVALVVLVYFVGKRLSKAKFHHVLPQQNSAEMALVTFALLLIVGATGSLSSPLFPLTYIHLFFLVMSSSRSTAAILGPVIALFHFALEPVVNTTNIGHLITIPVVLLFFMFAREQHEEVTREQQQLKQEEQLIVEYSKETEQLKSRIAQLEQDTSRHSVVTQSLQAALNRAQEQVFSWSQQYFACEPQALFEAESLRQQMSQALKEKLPTNSETPS